MTLAKVFAQKSPKMRALQIYKLPLTKNKTSLRIYKVLAEAMPRKFCLHKSTLWSLHSINTLVGENKGEISSNKILSY